jgi:hypothetical protein
LAAPAAASSPRIAAQLGAVEIDRAGRGKLPTHPPHGSAPWKLTALSNAKCAPKGG